MDLCSAAAPGIKVAMRRRLIGRATVFVAVALLLPLAMLLASCSGVSSPKVDPAPSASSPNRVLNIPSAAGTRYAIVHHPATAGRNPALVVVLNGAYGTAQQARASFGWDALADKNGFVVAYPNASGPLWNAGNCCGTAHTRDVDDVGFLHELLLRLQREDAVDPHRTYAVGLSNGAMMAYAWACARPGDLAGIGPVAGALVAPCTPPPAVTVVAVHGTADRNVPINGGVGPISVTHFRYPPLSASLAPFVTADGCAPQPLITHRPSVQISTWNCAGDRNVVVAVVQGMGHVWPGSRPLKPSKQRLVHQSAVPLDATSFLWSKLRSSELG
jgi:polyhydroxybutyrate depolymerase